MLVGSWATQVIPDSVVARSMGLVLLFHASFDSPPGGLEGNIDNVPPDNLRAMLSTLKQHYRFLFVDELFQARRLGKLAAVTFDDGYKSVVENALPVLADLDIPCTIFVNGATLEHKVFWRDKIRYVMNSGLAGLFESTLGTDVAKMGPLYAYTKDPRNNAKLIDRRLDDFLAANSHTFDLANHCFDDLSYFRRDRLVMYGSHSYSHYVLSSLSADEQVSEIDANDRLLRSLDVDRSEVFSLPFGGKRDINAITFRILRERGYQGVLFAKGRLNRKVARLELPALDRIMPGPLSPSETAGLLRKRWIRSWN